MKRKRRQPGPSEFQDPLKDYNAPDYEDDFEQSLLEDTTAAIKPGPVTQVPPDTTIETAVKLMAKHNLAAIIITQNNKAVGIFSERDVLNRIATDYNDMKSKTIAEYMTPIPATIYESDPPAKALNTMATGHFRHVPVLNQDEKPVGIIGAQQATQYLQQYLNTKNND